MALLGRKKKEPYLLDKREFHSRIKDIVGLSPTDISIYEKALIHRSATFIKEDGTRINNERLEFLGDAILDAILSDYLCNKFPEYDEGKLTKIRARVVNRDVLNKLAFSLGIDTLLISHINNKSKGKKLYGDALEALIGSVFLDKGYLRTKNFIIKRLLDKHLDIDLILSTERDYKSQVYQWSQKLNRNIELDFVEEFVDQQKDIKFTATLRIDHEIFGQGSGMSKREAEQIASYLAWTKIQKIGFID